MPGIGIIINPYSKSHLRDPSKADRMGFIVGDRGSCHATQSLQDVELLAREFKERSVDIMGISGGDGTIHLTLTSFIKVYGDTPLPKIAFLRGGTMNTIATTLKIKGATEKLLSNLIVKYHSDEPFEETEVDMLRINDVYGFLFGIGAACKFIEKYNNHKNGEKNGSPAPFYALKLLTHGAFSSLFHTKLSLEICERLDANITIDGHLAPFQNYTMAVAGTIESLGFNFRPLYRCREVPEKFQFVGISTTPRNLLATFPHALMGKPSPSEDYFDQLASHITINFAKPQNYMIDGDILGPADRIELSRGPRLRVIIS